MKQRFKNLLTFLMQRLVFFPLARAMPALPGGVLMVIAPHPDDEALGCGGLIARARDKDKPVRIVFVTNGSAAPTLTPMARQELAALRKAEATRAAAALGVPPEWLVFLDFEDSPHFNEKVLENKIEDIAKALASQLWLHAPTTILSPYGQDAHPDHRAIAAAIDLLCRRGDIRQPVFEYPLWYWPCRAARDLFCPRARRALCKVDITIFRPQKKAAIRAHASQFGTLSGAEGTGHLPKGFARQHLQPYELYFEKTL